MLQAKEKQLLRVTVGILLLLILSGSILMIANRGDSEPADSAAVLSEPSGTLQLLVAGTDRASGLADVLMLVSVNGETGEVCMLQIPRDTYGQYTKRSYRKLNGMIRSLGDMEAAKDFLSDAMGISIDRYLLLSPDAFRSAVDAVGGVELVLEEPMDYNDPAQGLSIHLPAGRQTLDGRAAEYFVRYRSDYVRGDLGRMDAQKQFLAALLGKVRGSMSVWSLGRLAVSLLDEVETDLSVSEIMTLAGTVFSAKSEQVLFVTAPGTDVIGENSGASYYVLSAPSMERLLGEYFGGQRGAFDPEGLFCYPSEVFRRAYRAEVAYVPISANEIEKNGIEIPRT